MVGKLLLHLAFLATSWAQGFNDFEPAWYKNVVQKAKEAFSESEDLVDGTALLASSKMAGESCGSAEYAMQVANVSLDASSWTLRVKGRLARDLADGNISMKVHLGEAPPGMSSLQRIKREVVFSTAIRTTAGEPLCQHLARTTGTGCPLKAGPQDLRFGFDRLPPGLSSGKYGLEVQVADGLGKPVLCVCGELDVPKGPQGQTFRRLQYAPGYTGPMPVPSAAAPLGARALAAVLASVAAVAALVRTQ